MRKANLYQIFYNEDTRLALDDGFTPLDNRSNFRPDWAEYWVIRNFLKENALDDEDYYEFFSPKFNFKTNLNAVQVAGFIENHPNNHPDIFIFSPYWDISLLLQKPLRARGFLASRPN